MSFLKLAVHFFEMFLLLVVVESCIWYNLSGYFASLGNCIAQLSRTFLRNEIKVVGTKTWLVSAEKKLVLPMILSASLHQPRVLSFSSHLYPSEKKQLFPLVGHLFQE